jgi:transposase InsO family protein
MSVRRAIVAMDPSSVNVAEFCRAHAISTWFFWDLRRRHRRDGDVVLEPLSRAARSIANKTPATIEDAVVAKRKELVDAGLDAGPATIAFHLRDLDGLPSEATIWRILKARGFITADPSKIPKRAGRSFTAERANDCWQLDDTASVLADGSEIKILNVIDDHSRLLVASVAMTTCTGAQALSALGDAAETLGWPARFLSDNARAFRNVLADALAPLGISAGHSRPYHPQTNGKVERFHQTLKRWLAKQPAAGSLEELQHQLDEFRHLYNHHRPHRSLGRRFPADVWATAPKNGPADQPIAQATSTYTGPVRNGRVRVGHDTLITIGAAHNDRIALTIITGARCHVFIDGTLIRALIIDPTRRLQPLHNQPGRPRRLP